MAEKKPNLTDKQGRKQPDKKNVKLNTKQIKGEKNASLKAYHFIKI